MIEDSWIDDCRDERRIKAGCYPSYAGFGALVSLTERDIEGGYCYAQVIDDMSVGAR